MLAITGYFCKEISSRATLNHLLLRNEAVRPSLQFSEKTKSTLESRNKAIFLEVIHKFIIFKFLEDLTNHRKKTHGMNPLHPAPTPISKVGGGRAKKFIRNLFRRGWSKNLLMILESALCYGGSIPSRGEVGRRGQRIFIKNEQLHNHSIKNNCSNML